MTLHLPLFSKREMRPTLGRNRVGREGPVSGGGEVTGRALTLLIERKKATRLLLRIDVA
jgi:hypothetical protein